MSKDARNKEVELSPEEDKQFASLVALMARSGFGEEGPPRETTFAEIEQFGHQAGRMLARRIDAHLAEQHAAHFTDEQPCPTCSEKHPPEKSPHELPLQTPDGEVTLHEPTCRCSTCRRDFFPSANLVAD